MFETVDFNNMVAFYYVAKYMNFTKAAEHLCLTQSAVSTRIKKLEESMESELIVRSGRSMRLTESGELVYHFAQNLKENYSQIKQEVEQLERRKLNDKLKIGVTSILGELIIYNILAKYMSEIYQKYQAVDIQTSEYVMSSLENDAIDIAIMGHIGIMKSRETELVSLGSFENSIVVDTTLKSIEELKDRELLFLYDNQYAKESIISYLSKLGIVFKGVKTIHGNVYALLKVIESGSAFAVIPTYTVKQIGENLNVKTVMGVENFYFNLCAVMKKNSVSYEKSKNFIEYIAMKVEEMGLLKV